MNTQVSQVITLPVDIATRRARWHFCNSFENQTDSEAILFGCRAPGVTGYTSDSNVLAVRGGMIWGTTPAAPGLVKAWDIVTGSPRFALPVGSKHDGLAIADTSGISAHVRKDANKHALACACACACIIVCVLVCIFNLSSNNFSTSCCN